VIYLYIKKFLDCVLISWGLGIGVIRIGENLKYLIKNQKGSRSMQSFLDKIYPEHVNILLNTISTSLKDIMMDPYGNYFIQKLIQCSSLNQRNIIFDTVKFNLIN
jgi:hypothetical protein